MAAKKSSTPFLRAIVHIGPVKTGSTAFSAQMKASQERGNLGDSVVYAMPLPVGRGVKDVVVRPEQIRYLLPRLEWSRQSGDNPTETRSTTDTHGNRARDYLDALVAQLRARDSNEITVFFVEEALSRRTRPQTLSDELLARFDAVDYFFVARAQQFIVPSAISQRIKMAAYPRVWDSRVSNFVKHENLTHQFDYAEIVKRWSPTSPRVRLLPVPFMESDRGSQRLFYRILETVGVDVALGEPVPSTINATPSRFEIFALGLYKFCAIPWTRNGISRGGRIRRGFELMTRLSARFARLVRSPRWSISGRDRALIVNHYDGAPQRFAELLGGRAQEPEWQNWFRTAHAKD